MRVLKTVFCRSHFEQLAIGAADIGETRVSDHALDGGALCVGQNLYIRRGEEGGWDTCFDRQNLPLPNYLVAIYAERRNTRGRLTQNEGEYNVYAAFAQRLEGGGIETTLLLHRNPESFLAYSEVAFPSDSIAESVAFAALQESGQSRLAVRYYSTAFEQSKGWEKLPTGLTLQPFPKTMLASVIKVIAQQFGQGRKYFREVMKRESSNRTARM